MAEKLLQTKRIALTILSVMILSLSFVSCGEESDKEVVDAAESMAMEKASTSVDTEVEASTKTNTKTTIEHSEAPSYVKTVKDTKTGEIYTKVEYKVALQYLHLDELLNMTSDEIEQLYTELCMGLSKEAAYKQLVELATTAKGGQSYTPQQTTQTQPVYQPSYNDNEEGDLAGVPFTKNRTDVLVSEL